MTPPAQAVPDKSPGTPRLFGSDRVYERWRWQIFGITWLAYAGFYLTRKSFAVAKVGIGKGTPIGLSLSELAWIDGVFLTAYAAGQFVWGIAGDRFGTRKVILSGRLFSILVGVATGFGSTMAFFALFLGLQGIAQSAGWAPLTKNISTFFSQRERGVVMGLWCTNYAIGGFIATNLAAKAGEAWGWRYAFFVPAAALVVVWILFFLLQRDKPEDVGLTPIEQYHGEAPAAPPASGSATGNAVLQPAQESWQVILAVLRDPMVILLTLVYFLLKPARYAILLWGPQYAHERLGTGMAESGFIGAMFELAGPLSVFLGGLISDKLFGARRMPISVLCLFALAGVLFCMDKLPNSRWVLAGSLFLIGLLLYAPDSLISGTAAVDFGTKRGASTATGLINGGGSIGAIVGGTIPGFFAAKWGWNGVFVFLGGAVLLAGLILLPKWNAVPNKASSSRG